MYLIYIRVTAHNYSSFSTYIHRFILHSVHSRELLSRHIFTVLLRIRFTQENYFLDINSPFYSAFSTLKRTTFSTYIHRFTPHSVHSRELLFRHNFTVLLRIQFTQELPTHPQRCSISVIEVKTRKISSIFYLEQRNILLIYFLVYAV